MTCNECNNPCKKGCKPAKYARGFYDKDNTCGETDTKLSTDYSSATLNYAAEKHTDQITGSQLGGLINLPDLRDVNIDYDFNAMCGEFIYHKYGECGDGCKSLEDAWNIFTIDSDGAKQNQIQYMRGANAYGCPVFLDVPSNQNQYWFAGWRPNGQFGYYQATPQPNINGDVLWIGNNGQVNSSPMSNASGKIYNTYCRGNSAFQGGYYYPANSNYDIAIGPDSVHGMVSGIYVDATHPSDTTVSNLNQDVLAIVRFCMDFSGGASGESQDKVWRITPYTQGPNGAGEVFREELELQRALHMETKTSAMACPGCFALRIPKGQHLVLHVAGDQGQGNFRLHQIGITWIPANIVSTVNEIIQ